MRGEVDWGVGLFASPLWLSFIIHESNTSKVSRLLRTQLSSISLFLFFFFIGLVTNYYYPIHSLFLSHQNRQNCNCSLSSLFLFISPSCSFLFPSLWHPHQHCPTNFYHLQLQPFCYPNSFHFHCTT